jgi:hypothetical protein
MQIAVEQAKCWETPIEVVVGSLRLVPSGWRRAAA